MPQTTYRLSLTISFTCESSKFSLNFWQKSKKIRETSASRVMCSVPTVFLQALLFTTYPLEQFPMLRSGSTGRLRIFTKVTRLYISSNNWWVRPPMNKRINQTLKLLISVPSPSPFGTASAENWGLWLTIGPERAAGSDWLVGTLVAHGLTSGWCWFMLVTYVQFLYIYIDVHSFTVRKQSQAKTGMW